MSEPVRQSPIESALAARRRVCATVITVVLALAPLSVRAAPAVEAAPSTEPAAPASEIPDEAAVRSALNDGDLTTARELAVARSAADPSTENLVLEAQVWVALGDHENAERAYVAARDALPENAADQRELIDTELEALASVSRGTRADEPESIERERLDTERADRLAALAPKPLPPPIVDKPKPVPITKKWYFWVTLGAIAASAGAIIGIAAASAVEDNSNNAGTAAARQPSPVGGLMLRF
jgi:hypothetical protein